MTNFSTFYFIFGFVLALFVRTDEKVRKPIFDQWRCQIHASNNKQLRSHPCYVVIY